MVRRARKEPVYAGRGGVRREVKSILFGGARRRRRLPRLRAALAAALAAAIAMAVVASSQARPAGEGAAAGGPAIGGPGVGGPGVGGPGVGGPGVGGPGVGGPGVGGPGVGGHAIGAAGRSPDESAVRWRPSRAVGTPSDGRLVGGVRLPAQGTDFFTHDAILDRRPNRPWRRHGTGRLVRVLLRVVHGFRAAHPGAPRVGIGDLSRPSGGDFGVRFGGLGHLSHQNGLDADVYYPRRDGREDRPDEPSLVHRGLAQELVDRFVHAGAEKVFVGPSLGLDGPAAVVVPLAHHDDHLHVRLPKRPPDR